MNEIRVLPSHISDLIAAGEVVDRPASVVKELIENSLDAGATVVTVEIQNGGLSYIRVSDNGRGIEREQAATAFLRHATSKIRTKSDLDEIKSLGFRGEALAAIAAVSKIEIITKTADSDEGTRLTLEAGDITGSSGFGCPDGTVLIVRELFYNTPARRKFLKKDSLEAGYVQSAVENAALARPDVSFRLIKDGRELLHTPGDNNLKTAIYCLFGRELYASMLPCLSDYGGLKTDGMTVRPTECRGSRSMQFFFVNGRPVKNRSLTAALEQAYKNSSMTGRYPVCFLFINLPPRAVDVNVHPAKSEVKFENERAVFESVYFAVKTALEKDEFMPAAQVKEEAAAVPENEDFTPVSGKEETAVPLRLSDIRFSNTSVAQSAPVYNAKTPVEDDKEIPFTYTENTEYKYIGEAFGIYLLVENGDELIFVDKHAAHERVCFNRLRERENDALSQTLLSPAVICLSPVDVQILVENGDRLTCAGIEAEEFGQSEMLIRRLPSGVLQNEAAALLSELADMFRNGARDPQKDIFDEMYHTIACKAALRSGDKITAEEADVLIKAVLELKDVKFCPHGRPVAFAQSKSVLDRQFRRIL